MKSFLFLMSLILSPLTGHAYDLTDHGKITLQAIREYNQCAIKKLDRWNQYVILKANIDEDLNLVRKDLFYSHFYNPYKKITMFRYDSSVRVEKLQDSLETVVDQNNWNGFEELSSVGAIIHHIQDMTVPAHIIPVMHSGWTDGFESLSFEGDISSGWSCEQMQSVIQGKNPKELLRQTAIQTLENIDAIKVVVQTHLFFGDMTSLATGEDFWKASADNGFGHYGPIGNHFGEAKFSEGYVAYNVPAEFYSHFKQAQMRLAVQSTLSVLHWYSLLEK